MSCCAPTVELADATIDRRRAANDELLLASRDIGEGLRQTDLSVPAIHCGGCIQKIEKALGALPGVEQARVNLSTRRVTIRWRADGTPPPFIESLSGIGYEAHLHDMAADATDGTMAELVRALAVAGFAASNIMLLSVSIWSGAEPATRDLFHWISALIALPAVAYSGRIFFRSAWQSLRHGQTNMDVPISIGVLLAFGLSLYETVHRGPHAYFDAAITLLFFLLVGRTLDHMMRERARAAVKGLARLAARGALILRPDGTQIYLPLNEIEPGMTILLTAGERVPVDGRVLKGQSDLDCSLVSGESIPQTAGAGSLLQAGTLNLTGPLTIAATAAAKDSFLAETIQMMEAAESGRSTYRRIADRAARLYAPVVHLTAVATFIGWVAATGDVHRALTIAIAVLIITCPCALGLAVPMVQVVAARRLFEQGIMVKDGGALERLAEVDTAVFDKTGTLTLGDATAGRRQCDRSRRACAGCGDRVALTPPLFARARRRRPSTRRGADRAGSACPSIPARDWKLRSVRPCIGSADPNGRLQTVTSMHAESEMAIVVLTKAGRCLATFRFEDRLRIGCSRGARGARGRWSGRRGLVRRSRRAGAATRCGAWRPLLFPGVSGRQGSPYRVDRGVGTKGPDDRRRSQRRTGAGCCARLDGAGIRCRCRPQRRRSGVPPREPAGGAAGSHRCAKREAAGPGKSGHRRRLQCDRIADRHSGICDAADRGGGHVAIVIDRRCQRTAPWWRSSEKATQRQFVEKQSSLAAICTGERQMMDFFYLIPVALALGAAGLAAFMWSLKSGQYEDLDGAAERILSKKTTIRL